MARNQIFSVYNDVSTYFPTKPKNHLLSILEHAVWFKLIFSFTQAFNFLINTIYIYAAR